MSARAINEPSARMSLGQGVGHRLVAIQPLCWVPSVWPPPRWPSPTATQIPLLLFLNLVQATVLGLGVSFLAFGLSLVRKNLPRLEGEAWAMYLSIAYLMVSCWPHNNMRPQRSGQPARTDLHRLPLFTCLLMIGALVLAYCFFSLLREERNTDIREISERRRRGSYRTCNKEATCTYCGSNTKSATSTRGSRLSRPSIGRAIGRTPPPGVTTDRRSDLRHDRPRFRQLERGGGLSRRAAARSVAIAASSASPDRQPAGADRRGGGVQDAARRRTAVLSEELADPPCVLVSLLCRGLSETQEVGQRNCAEESGGEGASSCSQGATLF